MAMDKKLLKKLQAAKAAFAKARKTVEEGGGKGGDFFNEVGRFDTQITDGEVNESQNGRLQCFLEFTILDGEFKGEAFRNYWGLEADADKLSYLIKDMARLGEEVPEDLEEIEEFIAGIVKKKPKVKVRRVEKGEFVNNYIGKLIDGDDAADAASDAAHESAPDFTPEVGAEVTTPDGDGTVKSIDEDDKDAIVKLESGEKKSYKWADLSAKGEAGATSSGGDFTPEEGQRVVHADHGAGVVKSVDADDKDALVKFDDGKKDTVAWDTLTAEEDATGESATGSPAGDESADIVVGKMLVVAKHGLGKVVKIDEDKPQVDVKIEKTGKIVKVTNLEELSAAPKKKAGLRVSKK